MNKILLAGLSLSLNQLESILPANSEIKRVTNHSILVSRLTTRSILARRRQGDKSVSIVCALAIEQDSLPTTQGEEMQLD